MSATIPCLTANNSEGSSWHCHQDPDLWIYRDRTTALLRRYLHMSVDIGRIPSLLGRELFRSRITCYRLTTFEDAVIFVHDVETAISHLDGFSQQLTARVVLQEYTECEAARILHCGLRTIQRLLPEAVDQLTAVFLRGGLLVRIGDPPGASPCQYDKTQHDHSTHSHCTK